MIRSNRSASHSSRSAWVERAPLLDPSVHGHAGAERRRARPPRAAASQPYLVASGESSEYRSGTISRYAGHERRVLGLRDAQRRVEDGGVERAAAERHEDPALARPQLAQPNAAASDEGTASTIASAARAMTASDHGVSLSRSARLATTRMSMPGSSRTMRESSEPPKISRRRDSSGVPTNT